MEIFKILNGFDGHALHFVYHRPSHLRAVIALDSVVEGRCVGGIRNMDYPDEEEAVEDACRLARAMSFKAALAELPCGGAKAVIYSHPNLSRAEAYSALGRAIEQLGGLYHAGADIGTTVQDLEHVAKETRHVSHELDFGRHTARGLLAAIRAAVKFRDGADTVREVRVAIQGLGEVGMELAKLLYDEGARLVVADPVGKHCEQAQAEYHADVVSPEQILFEPCDVFAPCAVGGVINEDNVRKLACRMIAGSANNILTEASVANDLMEAEIVFVPDIVSSAGALIIGVTELTRGKEHARPVLVDSIYDTTLKVLRHAKQRGMSTLHAAETLAAKALKR